MFSEQVTGIEAQQTSANNIDRQYPEADHADMVRRLAKPGEDILEQLTPEKAHIWHMASAAQSEGGELFDAVKRWCIHNKPITSLDNIIEELGDLEFYLEGVRAAFGITRERTLIANMNKLEKGDHARYKSGAYSDDAAHQRADKAAEGQKPLPSATDQSNETPN